MASENKLQDVIRTSLENIKNLVDSDTIIGTPIETKAGTTLIPISKISVGYASGGIDYAGKKDVSNKPNNFGGGGGTGISVTPVAFLVINKNGDVSVLNVNSAAPASAPADAVSTVVGFLERSPDLLEKIRGVFSKKGEENKI